MSFDDKTGEAIPLDERSYGAHPGPDLWGSRQLNGYPSLQTAADEHAQGLMCVFGDLTGPHGWAYWSTQIEFFSLLPTVLTFGAGDAVIEGAGVEGGDGFLARLGVRRRDETGARGRYGNLVRLSNRLDEKLADVIKSRGGGAQQLRQLQTGYGELTMRELSEMAARGDREAVRAIKMAKQAGTQGKGGR